MMSNAEAAICIYANSRFMIHFVLVTAVPYSSAPDSCPHGRMSQDHLTILRRASWRSRSWTSRLGASSVHQGSFKAGGDSDGWREGGQCIISLYGGQDSEDGSSGCIQVERYIIKNKVGKIWSLLRTGSQRRILRRQNMLSLPWMMISMSLM